MKWDSQQPAGRELDASIAEAIFGGDVRWERGEPGYTSRQTTAGKTWSSWAILPSYSTDLTSAWRVVEHLRKQGWLIRVQEMPDGFPYRGPDDMDPQPQIYKQSYCLLSWMPRERVEDTRRFIRDHPSGIAETAAHAICLAALDSVEIIR